MVRFAIPKMRVLTALLCGQLAFAPTLALAQTPPVATQQSSDAYIPTQPPSQVINEEPSEDEGLAPAYTVTQEELATQAQVPVLKLSYSLTNPATLEPQNIVIEYAVSHNEYEYRALQAWQQAQVKQNVARGDQAKLILSSIKGDAPNSVPNVSPADYGLRPMDVIPLQLDITRMAKFKSWIDSRIELLEERYQRRQVNRLLDKIDAARSKELQKEIKANKRASSLYGKFIKWFMTTNVGTASPWKVNKDERKKPTKLYEATFTIARIAGVKWAVTYALQHNHLVPLPAVDIELTSYIMAFGSGIIMVNGKSYLQWFKKAGWQSKKFIRPAFRTSAKLARPFIRGLAKLVGSNLGQSPNSVAQWDKKFSKSIPHRIADEMTKYVSTEVPFVSVPGIIAYFVSGIVIYPAALLTAAHVPGDGSIAHTLQAVTLPMAYVLKHIADSAIQGYLGQGIPDTANAGITHGLKVDIRRQRMQKEISKEEAEVMQAKLDFNSQLTVFAVSIVSNLGVVLGIPDSHVSKQIGSEIIRGLTYTGAAGWIYSTARYDRHFQKFVLRNWLPLRDKILTAAFPPANPSCAAYLLKTNFVM